MTTRWRPDVDPDHLYFVTTTAAEHTHVFHRDIVKRQVVDALYFVSLMNHVKLYAFVVMPNHVHAIIQCPLDCPPADWARAFKTSSAQLVVRHYQVQENQKALGLLASLVARPDKQVYKVWEDGYLSKGVATAEFLSQKLMYIHNNPLQPAWRLVDAPEEYAWSTARFYLGDGRCIIPTQDVRELLG